LGSFIVAILFVSYIVQHLYYDLLPESGTELIGGSGFKVDIGISGLYFE
jgi:hypothetical protein